jgi:hypothetical protein
MSTVTKQTNPYPVDASVPFHEVDVTRIFWDTPKRNAEIGELKFAWDRDTNFVYVTGADQTFEDEETEEKHTLVSLQNAYERNMKSSDETIKRKNTAFSEWIKEEKRDRKNEGILSVFDRLMDEELTSNSISGIPANKNDPRILTLADMTPKEKVEMLIQKIGSRRYQRTYVHFRVAQLYIGSISPKVRALMDSAYDRLHKGDMTLIAETMNNNTRATSLVHSVIAANDANGNVAVVIKSQFASFREAGTDHKAILANLQNMPMIDIAKTIANLNNVADKREAEIKQRAEEKHAEHMAKIDAQTAKIDAQTAQIDKILKKQTNAEGMLDHIELELDAARQDLFEANSRLEDSEKREKKMINSLRDVQLKLADKKIIIAKSQLEIKRKDTNVKYALEDRVVAANDITYDGRFILLYNRVIDMYAVIRCIEKNTKRLVNRYSSNYEIVVNLRSPNPRVLYKKIKESASDAIEFSGVDFRTTLPREDVIKLVQHVNDERYML